jgi:hypothetical protein
LALLSKQALGQFSGGLTASRFVGLFEFLDARMIDFCLAAVAALSSVGFA